MPTWLLNPTTLRWIGVGLLAFGNIVLFGMYKHTSDAFSDYKTEIAAQVKSQEQHNQQVLEQRDLFNKGVVDGYKAKLAAANSYINSLHYNGSSSMPSSSDAATGVNGDSQDDIPSASILASDCAATTVQLVQLQQWAKGQVEIKWNIAHAAKQNCLRKMAG